MFEPARRAFLFALGVSALAAPLGSSAQQRGKIWRVGFFYFASRQSLLDAGRDNAFLQGMRELGYVEGKNLVIEWRFADGKPERLPGLAAELVRLKVDVIVAGGTPGVGAAQKATSTIPIVMVNVADPVGSGFVASLARPGGNITGLSNIAGDIGPKHLEMLLSMVPKLSRVAVLMNPTNSSHAAILKSVEAAAQKSRVRIVPVEARTPREIESTFFVMTQERAGAVIVAADQFFLQQRQQIADLAAKNQLPSISVIRELVEAGGLMSYGSSNADDIRRAAAYVDKIFKGAKPGDLPVEQPMTFELLINGKTAKALGLTIPQTILVRADRVIE